MQQYIGLYIKLMVFRLSRSQPGLCTNGGAQKRKFVAPQLSSYENNSFERESF